MKKKLLVGLGALLLSIGTAGAQYVRFGPPPPPPEHRIPPPDARYVWVPGYHRWDGHNYVWVGGRWTLPPRPRAYWVPGHWDPRPGGYFWVAGHWA